MKFVKLFEEYRAELYHCYNDDIINDFDIDNLGNRSSKLVFFFTND